MYLKPQAMYTLKQTWYWIKHALLNLLVLRMHQVVVQLLAKCYNQFGQKFDMTELEFDSTLESYIEI